MTQKKGDGQMDAQITLRLPAKLVRLIDVCSKRTRKNRTEYVRDTLIARIESDLQGANSRTEGSF